MIPGAGECDGNRKSVPGHRQRIPFGVPGSPPAYRLPVTGYRLRVTGYRFLDLELLDRLEPHRHRDEAGDEGDDRDAGHRAHDDPAELVARERPAAEVVEARNGLRGEDREDERQAGHEVERAAEAAHDLRRVVL